MLFKSSFFSISKRIILKIWNRKCELREQVLEPLNEGMKLNHHVPEHAIAHNEYALNTYVHVCMLAKQ